MAAPVSSRADTIRVLISTDNHIGYEERDPIRKNDSWETFDEILKLAVTEDVDLVLLAGDLFHDNRPSQKSMNHVMRILGQYCLGDKPIELEFLSDPHTVFRGESPRVNYENENINVAIPVFSIHGNHDDPSGDEHICSLDLLHTCGLLNYFGHIKEADSIDGVPILLKKGSTKLALYGLGNVRDERMHRTFRDGGVKWFKPEEPADTSDGSSSANRPWFNLLAVHQNHHAHTATSYLPENFLPDFMDLIVWGHEHECLIDPRKNAETGFHVMQPGSSVATSLVPGEAVAKHVAILNITGKSFQVQKIALRTVRPMIVRDLVLAEDKRFKNLDKQGSRQELTKRLINVVEEMIEEAHADWLALQDDTAVGECPLPLVRLKIEHTPAEGGNFELENPQRFSNRFQGKVANVNHVVYYHRKKSTTGKGTAAQVPDALNHSGEEIRVEDLVHGFLSAQSLKVLPQVPFADAVNLFVNKDDKHAMETFVKDSLSSQVNKMLTLRDEDEDLASAMEQHKTRLEAQFAAGHRATGHRVTVKPKPDGWDSDLDGHWDSVLVAGPSTETGKGPNTEMGLDDDDDEEAPPSKRVPAKRAARVITAKASAAKKPAKPKVASRGRGKKTSAFVISDEEDDAVSEDEISEDSFEPAPAKRTRR